jgi:hypothetical protein
VTAGNWTTIADLGTALGTLVLAVATFSAVRSGNRTARAAEQSLLTSLRPLLMPSKLSDDALKVNFGDNKWMRVPGGSAMAEVGGGDGTMGPSDGVIYLTISLRNVGNGIAVLHGWRMSYERAQPNEPMPPLDSFTMQSRDMYIPVDDTGFWQAAIRDPADPRYEMARKVAESRSEWFVDLLYGDHDGGQRTISRFRCQHLSEHDGRLAADDGPGDGSFDGQAGDGTAGQGPGGGGSGGSGGSDGSDGSDGESSVWLATVARHWTIDQPDPRSADRSAFQ